MSRTMSPGAVKIAAVMVAAVIVHCTEPTPPPGGPTPIDPCPQPARRCPDSTIAVCRDTGWYCPGDPAGGCDSLWIRDTLTIREILDSNGMTTVGVWEVIRPGEWDTCGRIVRLDLSPVRLSSLSGGRGRPVRILPPCIGRLDRLRTLDIHNSPIGSLPAAIAQLRFLRELKVNRCGLTEVPDEICGLDSLAILYLNDNALERLPDSIGRLRMLVHLELWNNALDSLPLSLRDLPHIHMGTLTIDSNYLCTVSPALAVWLDTVAYGGSRWRAAQRGCALAVADTMAVRTMLDNAGYPGVGVGEVARMDRGRVVRLDMSDRSLSVVPSQVFELTALRHLDLSGNHLNGVSGAIDSLGALRTLDLSGNSISSPGLPSLRRLAQLRELDLSGNLLTEPPGLESLDSLRVVNLSNNRLETLSLVTWELPRGLISLDLSGNQVSRLPLAFGGLRQLQVVDISRNQIDSLHSVDGLVSARVVRASHNRLRFIPRLDSLRAVDVLDLARNALEALPPTVGALTTLDTLDISHNALATLPQEIAALSGPVVVRCAGNRLCAGGLTPLVWLWLTQHAESNWDSLQTCP